MNQKRTSVILVAMFYILAVCAQDYAPHRVYINYGAGYAGSMYNKVNQSFIHTNYTLGQTVEVKYACFFAPKWGVGLGAGVSQYAAKNTLNIAGVIPHYNDPTFDPTGQRYYDLHYQTDKKAVITPEHNSLYTVNALPATNFLSQYNHYIQENHINWKKASEKWNQWYVGVKIGIHFKNVFDVHGLVQHK